MKVLVKEKIADAGVELLRENFDVDLGLEMADEELERARSASYDAILIRSATKMTAGADRPGRQPEGDRPRRHRRRQRRHRRPRPGAGSSSPTRPSRTRSPPPSTRWRWRWPSVRNVPQAARLAGRRRAGTALKFKGAELYGKTLGVIGFGRIGQLVAKRAQAFEMEVVAFDKFVSAERFRELGVEGVESLEELLRARRPRHPAPAEDAGDDRPDRRRGDRRR